MPIKRRLRLSYVAMLIIPIILSVIALGLIFSLFKLEINKAYNIKLKGSPMEQFNDKSKTILDTIRDNVTEDGNFEENIKYFKELDLKLKENNTGVILRKENKVVYTSEFLNKTDILKGLPEFGSYVQDNPNHTLFENQLLLMKQRDFYFEDKTSGSIFIVIDITAAKEISYKYIIFSVISILLILGLTNAFLTHLVSKSIIKPIDNLKEAAKKISEGDLSFEINTTGKDEIAELHKAFENMRVKLKESIDIQLQYENNRKELLSSISHDLKTPTTAIKGYIEGIMDGIADTPDKMDKYIKTISSKANSLDKLIDELFLFSKLDLKSIPFNFEKIELLTYLQDCVEELCFDVEKRGIKLEMKSSVQYPTFVKGDREKLRRVIVNIVDNAVKYMNKKDGNILVNLKEDKGFLLLEIMDNGQGISKEDLPFIFENFYRADSSRNSTTGGSGLGLAIAKRIIEEHGGSIQAYSEEGKGTNISFTLLPYNQ